MGYINIYYFAVPFKALCLMFKYKRNSALYPQCSCALDHNLMDRVYCPELYWRASLRNGEEMFFFYEARTNFLHNILLKEAISTFFRSKLCVCVYLFFCLSVCLSLRLPACLSVSPSICIYMYVCMYVFMYIIPCMYICMYYVRMCVMCVCTYIGMYVRTYVCTYVCTFVVTDIRKLCT